MDIASNTIHAPLGNKKSKDVQVVTKRPRDLSAIELNDI